MNKLIIVSAFLLFWFPGKSQYPEMKFVDILNRKHLTSSFATSIAQDSSGFIWIGTNNGLNRFDGYQTKYYLHVTGDSTSIVSNSISVLFVDAKGRMWVGMRNGLSLYDKFTDRFIPMGHQDNQNGLAFLGVTQIKNGPDNKVYVSSGNVIHVFDESKKTFSEFIRVKSGEICNFVFDKNNSIWIGVQDIGLYRYSNDQKFINFYNHATKPEGLSNNKLRDIDLRGDSLWIATFGGGVNILNIPSGQFSYLDAGEDEYSKYVKEIYVDNNYKVWAINIDALSYYDDANKKFYSNNYAEIEKFRMKESINKLFQDVHGNYWTIHFPGGVGLQLHSRGFASFSNTGTGPLKLSEKSVMAISADKDGNFWFGYSAGGIDVFNLQKQKVISYHPDKKNPYSLSSGTVHTLFKDSRGVMWVGTYDTGLQYFNSNLQQFHSFHHKPDDLTTIAGNDVRAIEEDKDGNLWLVVHGHGINKMDVRTRKFTHYTFDKNKLANDWTLDLMFDKEENLWVATTWGLSKLKKGAVFFENFHTSENNKNTLSSNQVICLHQDKNGIIWIGTSAGLNRYNPQTNDFTRIKLPWDNIFIAGIASDTSNNLWISTLSGLKLFNPANDSWLNFNETDGLISEEFNVNSLYEVSKNYLMFGGTEGVDVITPDQLYSNKAVPKVVLTDFKLFYESVTNYGENSPIKKNITYAEQIVLDFSQNIIGFEFVALNMNQSFKNEYAYQMVGFDKDWVYSGTRNNATYTNLNPGKYTFKVKACNNDKVWNDQGVSIDIIINPPWWQTWWAISLFITIFILAVSGIYLFRINALKRQKEELKKQVENKTKELNEKNKVLVIQAENLNDANTVLEETQQLLEEQSEELKNQALSLRDTVRELEKSNASKNRLFSIISHDLRSPFNSILGFLDMLYTDFHELDEESRLSMLEQANQSSKNVFTLLENMLTWAKSQIDEISFSPKLFEINYLLDEVLSVFTPQIEKKSIKLETRFEIGVKVYADKDLMKIVFRNLISNAIKFTQKNGHIFIESKTNGKNVIISIKDSGTGMDDEVMNGLFEISKQKIRRGTEGEAGSGLGLILCKEFIEKNNATITVESTVNQGSTFIINIPAVQH